jgi:hypothetical protein
MHHLDIDQADSFEPPILRTIAFFASICWVMTYFFPHSPRIVLLFDAGPALVGLPLSLAFG